MMIARVLNIPYDASADYVDKLTGKTFTSRRWTSGIAERHNAVLKTIKPKPISVEEKLRIKFVQVKARLRKHLSEPKPDPKRLP